MKNHAMKKTALAIALALSFGALGTVHAADVKGQESRPAGSVAANVSDARREGQIWTSYAMNPHLKAFDLHVEVKGDKAIIDGKVESAPAKDLAEQIARGVEGIRTVDNRIVVDANYVPPARTASERTFGQKVEDATITASVKSKLLWNSNTDGLDINVDTADGKVTLTGTAQTALEKDLAGRIARNTAGVVGVNNQIALGSSTREVAKADIKGAAHNTKESIKEGAREAKAETKEKTAEIKADTREKTAEVRAETREKTADAKAATKEAAHESKVAVTDAWITGKVKSTLLLTRNVDGLDINVDTKDGVVSLKGEVDSAAERDRAVELASTIRGVKKVDPSGIKVR